MSLNSIFVSHRGEWRKEPLMENISMRNFKGKLEWAQIEKGGE